VKSCFAVSWSNSALAVSYLHARGSKESKASTETCSRPIPTLVGNRAFSPLQNYKKPQQCDNCLVRIHLEDSRLASVLLTNVCHLQKNYMTFEFFIFIFILWGGTSNLRMPMLRPASQAGPMHNPREGTSAVLRDTTRLT